MTVVEAFLAEGCTLLVPTMSWTFAVPPPPHLRPKNNAWDYKARDQELAGKVLPGTQLIFTTDSDELSKEMGAIPAAALRLPERVRGNHALGSFTAVGPYAQLLLKDQTPEDPFAPFRELEALHGYALLMGVGLNRLTLLHHAEVLAGRNLFMRWANAPDGQPIGVRGGDCSDGFPRLMPALVHLMRELFVGSSRWIVLPVGAALEAAAQAIRTNPSITHCADPECPGCRDALLGGPIL